jgi:hypothetical protein
VAEFIHFDLQSRHELKTKVWVVWSGKEGFEGNELGEVKFYPQWRKYSFFPASQTLFEHVCLRDIAEFCEEATAEWRKSLKLRQRPAERKESE